MVFSLLHTVRYLYGHRRIPFGQGTFTPLRTTCGKENLPIIQTRERYFHIVVPLLITLVANIIAVSTLNITARCTYSHDCP
jgi:hypothetical protein